jgi:hypothetical protein
LLDILIKFYKNRTIGSKVERGHAHRMILQPTECDFISLHFTFSYTVYTKKYCNHEKIWSRVWWIYMFSTPEIRISSFFKFCASKYVRADVALTSAWMVGWILFTFGIQEFIHHRLMPHEYHHSVSKNRGTLDFPRNMKWQFCCK